MNDQAQQLLINKPEFVEGAGPLLTANTSQHLLANA